MNAPQSLPKNRLIAATVGTLAVAALVVVGAVLPAEYNLDPLGVGRLTGLSRLWAPDDRTVAAEGAGPAAREYRTPYRTDVVEIPLGGFLDGADRSQLEYKVRMAEGATLTYAWQALGATDARDVRFDQHGHTTPKPGEGMSVVTYRQGAGLSQQGALTAPFEGIHGWQFVNGGDGPVVIRLRLSGFYELVPPGAAGNEAGVVANVPAAQAAPGR
ncbi:hypothetical protein LRS10_13205 [Phenylobacterium sp. J426]|uniref:hypothetical protein n=1 Tax=Phenylobacterium sp. J426 TaxID=2898439 RepID=UPI0021516808|nr:hypothetical protein [Phenylobacterium sp. J426]MCR5875054.1 hypothetical protein [Phenylobacterium sp. J426]